MSEVFNLTTTVFSYGRPLHSQSFYISFYFFMNLKREKGDHEVYPIHTHINGAYDSAQDKEKYQQEKSKKTHVRPVPLLSRIPLFEKIMAEQEARYDLCFILL